MVQVKKDNVRKAILKSAKKLYAKHGYVNTSMNAIAKEANISTSNLYNYFDSKLEVLYEVYAPWLIEHMRKLEAKVADVEDPAEHLRIILNYVWIDIPESDRGFANNIVQALSNLRPNEQYNRDLLFWFEDTISRLLEPAIKEEYKKYIDNNVLAHLISMAFDGYVMNYRLTKTKGKRYTADRVDEIIQILSEFLVVEPRKSRK